MAIEQGDALFRSIVEAGSDLVSVFGPGGDTLYCSPSFERILGWKDGSCLEADSQAIHRDDLALLREAIEQVLREPESPCPLQLRMRHGNGDWRLVEGTLSNRLETESVGGLLLVGRDVTIQEQTMAAFAVSEAHLREAQRIAKLGSWVLEAERDRISWSEEAARIVDLEPGDEGPATFSEFIEAYVHPEDRQALLGAAADHLGRGGDSHAEIRIIRRDGSLRYIQLLARMEARGEGQPAVLAGTIQDMTERRQAELELERHRHHLQDLVAERTRELEQSRAALARSERLASLGTLSAGMAHQINNPVGGILLAAESALLDMEEPEPLLADLREVLREIAGQAQRCGRIVRSVLKFSRNEAVEKWTADLREVVRCAHAVTSAYVAERSAKLSVEVGSESLPVRMNPIEVEQVLVNLIRNAVESAARGVNATLRVLPGPEHIRVEVSDDGRGIAAEDLQHVFDPFFTTRLYDGGTGLGLSVAHGITRDHGGRLEVESAPGEGTRIVMELPRA